MPVDTKHKQFNKWEPIWQRCRDVAAGQDAVHNKGTLYLPKLTDEEDDSYNARKQRASFYDATARTIEGLSGMLFRKEPVVEANGQDELVGDINLSGSSLYEFLTKATDEALTVNRFGILVDYPSTDPNQTEADAKAKKLRPYANLYKAESIINWATGKVGNDTMLTLVVLHEMVSVPKDEFESEEKDQWRVLDLVEGWYRVRVYQKEKERFVLMGSDHFPVMGSKKMSFIPFYFYPEINVEQPALLGLVNTNLSHYTTTADYENGCHISGLPTLFITGYTPDKTSEKIYVGGGTANTLPSDKAKAFFVEVSGDFPALLQNLEGKEKRMAVLGSRMLEQQKKQAETAEVASIHRSGESSTLSSMSIMLSKTFTKVLQTLVLWSGAKAEDVAVELNRDFIPAGINPTLLTAMLGAVQAGEMSSEAFFENLKQGELYPDNVDYEEEQARIDNQSPPTPDA